MNAPYGKGEVDLVAQTLGIVAEHLALFLLQVQKQFTVRRNASRLLLVAFACICTVAVSQIDPAGGEGIVLPDATPQVKTRTKSSYPFDQDEILANIGKAVQDQLDALKKNKKLQEFGTTVTAFFLVLMLVWTSVKMLARGKNVVELIGDWVPIFISFGIVNLFLSKDAGALIVSTMDSVASSVGGDKISTLDSAIKSCLQPIFQALTAVIDQPWAGGKVLSLNPITFTMNVVAMVGSMIFVIIAQLVTAFLLLCMGVVMAAHVIMGYASVQLVLWLAPVMVPFLLFPPLAWIFDSWLKFLLGACMLKVVVAFLLAIAAGLLAGVSLQAQKFVKEAEELQMTEVFQADVLYFGLMVVFALLSTLLLAQAPSIASGLLSGSAGRVGFSGMNSISGGLATRAAGASPKAIQTALQPWRNAKAAKQGRKDRESGKLPSMEYRDPRAKAAYASAYRGTNYHIDVPLP